MSESNKKPLIFRTSLREWQAQFQARRALIAELRGSDEAPAAEAEVTAETPAAPLREKKFLPRKRIKRGAAIR